MDIGELTDVVTLWTPGAQVPDGEGGYTVTSVTLADHVSAAVFPATARDLERVIANTVQSTASHIVHMWYVPGVTTETHLTFHDALPNGVVIDREFAISGAQDPKEAHVELFLACTEAG